jgi:hypothetical protein
MDIRKIISKFLTQVCEKNYSEANKTLNTIVEEKTKKAIKRVANVKYKKKKVVKESEEKPKFKSTVKPSKGAPKKSKLPKAKYEPSLREVDNTEEWRNKKDALKKRR